MPSGTATLNDIVTDTAMAFAVANAIGMASRSPCLPSEADYRAHLAALPFRTSLFMGYSNRLNRPLARRLNLDTEGGMPQSIDLARKSGNIKDYYHIQEVAIGSVFRGHFLHADPFRVAEEAYGVHVDQMVVRLGLGRTGMGVLRRCTVDNNIYLNLHTALLFDPGINLEGGRTVCTLSSPAAPSHSKRHCA